jgi:predicted lipoprotein
LKKIIKYIVVALLVIFLGYNSIYFKKLDEVKLAASSKGFNAGAYTRNFYTSKLIPHLGNAVDLGKLITQVKTEPEKAFKEYSHALDIGNIRYFLVQSEGTITAIDEDAVSLTLNNDSAKILVRIETEYVYGNAIRDASGLINLTEFTNTADFNSVSEEINKIIRTEVVPNFRKTAKKGDVVKFSGAMELNQAHVKLDSLEIIPIQIAVLK